MLKGWSINLMDRKLINNYISIAIAYFDECTFLDLLLQNLNPLKHQRTKFYVFLPPKDCQIRPKFDY